MLVYYVEGDSGNLMHEVVGAAKYRTVVWGSCCSFQMPWEDVVRDLQANCSDRNIADLPRAQECLKYFLRVHLTVNGLDYRRHLKQLHVRPHVLLARLYFLIDRNHEAFRGKGSAQELYDKMREAVEREYPDHEQHKPEEDRERHIPLSMQESLDAFLSEEDRPRKNYAWSTTKKPHQETKRALSLLVLII